jgi:hypothetical protein
MVGGLIWLDCNRLTDHLNGDLMASTLMFHHSEQMQAVRLLGIQHQNLPVNGFRFGQSPGAVMPESFLQPVLSG